jgi:hypothetical protein
MLNDRIAIEEFSYISSNSSAKHFTQYLDKNDDAHILMLDENIPDKWIEIFTIDRSYCNFTNKHGTTVGRIKLENLEKDTWVFVTEKNGKQETVLTCKSKYPYDCEQEVIQWMININQLDYFINLK